MQFQKALDTAVQDGFLLSYEIINLDENGNRGQGQCRNTQQLKLTFPDGNTARIEAVSSGTLENVEFVTGSKVENENEIFFSDQEKKEIYKSVNDSSYYRRKNNKVKPKNELQEKSKKIIEEIRKILRKNPILKPSIVKYLTRKPTKNPITKLWRAAYSYVRFTISCTPILLLAAIYYFSQSVGLTLILSLPILIVQLLLTVEFFAFVYYMAEIAKKIQEINEIEKRNLSIKEVEKILK